ncbi:hypothetical protein NLJ89_g10919 [Agrocybe chaxingu]|uniref:Protein kinase domain-containing protein n=1 Tax=Agrocybe chaxingu TaxID=84603 RepID=A0A9W8JQX1_9AGAR|nr:hypothetical protein NLJ89_g10919 [Agrocybe chaxingu]
MRQYLSNNGLSHAARSASRRDFILRIVTAGDQGQDHLDIMRRLSSSPDILRGNNHILPMVKEITFADIVIGVFPRVMFSLLEAIDPCYMNSVEDVLYMVLQALEGIKHIHENRIAHRDLFLPNFMVEWMPESINERGGMTRPRVYIIDFETAVAFPEDVPESQRMLSEVPFPVPEYSRQRAPEWREGQPYCPFRMDIWQLGSDLRDSYPTGIPEVDQLWADLAAEEPDQRPTAGEAMLRLDTLLRETPPSKFHVRSLVPEMVWG